MYTTNLVDHGVTLLITYFCHGSRNNKSLLKFLTGSIQCSEENDESLLPGSITLGTNNTSPAEHMDLFHVESAVVKKIEYLHFKTSNHGEMNFYYLELK